MEKSNIKRSWGQFQSLSSILQSTIIYLFIYILVIISMLLIKYHKVNSNFLVNVIPNNIIEVLKVTKINLMSIILQIANKRRIQSI